MRIAWYLGFGWVAIAAIVACGIGINLTEGWVRWALYIPFLLLGLHMSIRFRSYSTQPWRRLHSRAMIDYGNLAAQEYDTARKEKRDFDVRIPCRALAEQVFGQDQAQEFGPLMEEASKAYYNNLVESYPHVFVEGANPDSHRKLLEGVHRDIDASQLGPDIVIAKAIELKHNGLEAARYLQALLLGRVR
jgi:hypothetical protein